MDATTFFSLSETEIADIVRAHGPKVCVFPINGTRRWFLLEYAPEPGADPLAAYVKTVEEAHINVYRLMFDHGIETLLTPCFGPDLLERGDEYIQMSVEGLERLATHPRFLDFYDRYDVRVRFYGDYRKYFDRTPYAYISDLFDQLTERTLDHNRCRLFFGLFANDATETISEIAVKYYQEYGRVPDREATIRQYYGEDVPPVDFFIGFDKFSAFDMPLIATGEEALYFTVAPSLYLSAPQLRRILYDHLYTRRDAEPDYAAMQPDDWAVMKAFYQANRDSVQGIGTRQEPGGYWHPLPEVKSSGFFSAPDS